MISGPVYPKILRIEVTQSDIDNGEPEQPGSCPIALAIERMFPDAYDVSVLGDNVRVDGYQYHSDAADAFVNAFDEGGPVEPCTIEVVR